MKKDIYKKVVKIQIGLPIKLEQDLRINMVNKIENLDNLKDIFEYKVHEVNILFLDLSSSCTGYSIVGLDFTHKKATFKKAGAIWFDSKWNNQEKYHYIFSAIINYFNITYKIDFCVCEAYMLNPKKRMGSLVGPELHGVVKVALAEIDIKYMAIPVQTWRKHLGIKKNKEGDYKEPTKIEIEKFVKIPDTIKSNITKSNRSTPNDLVDAIAIGLGSLKKWGIKNVDFRSIKFQDDI